MTQRIRWRGGVIGIAGATMAQTAKKLPPPGIKGADDRQDDRQMVLTDEAPGRTNWPRSIGTQLGGKACVSPCPASFTAVMKASSSPMTACV